MPVRSLTSSVLRWPNRRAVDGAVRDWAAQEARRHPELLRLGYFGSYARGDWGPGSDLDLVAVVTASGQPFEMRGTSWRVEELPLPACVLVYTRDEWQRFQEQGGRFARTLGAEAVWVWPPAAGGA